MRRAVKKPAPQADAVHVGKVSRAEAVRAVSNPVRAQILEALLGRSSSPNRLAHELDVPLATVAHHVIVLRDLGAIELTTTEQRRGATEHFYRARWKVRFEVEPVD